MGNPEEMNENWVGRVRKVNKLKCMVIQIVMGDGKVV